jgi:DNA-binding NarL/FixJ family response regulator
VSDGAREGQPLNQALLGKFADLRLRLAQVEALVNMLALRPDLLDDLLPKLREAVASEPVFPFADQADAESRSRVHVRRVPKRERQESDPLPARKLDVLELLAEELSVDEIAGRLYLSPHTVKSHLRWLYRHFGVNGSTGAVAKAFRAGIIE